MAEPPKIGRGDPGAHPPVSEGEVAVGATLPLAPSPRGRGDLPSSENDAASLFTTTSVPTAPEADPPIPYAVRMAPPPGAVGETSGPYVLTEIVDPRLADQLESDIAELAAAMPEMGDFFEMLGFAYLVERIRQGKSIPTYVVWNTGADHEDVTSLLKGPVREHDMPFTLSSALNYADPETGGLRNGLKMFSVKRHFPHFTVEVTLSLADLIHWFATHQGAIRREGNFIALRHEFLGEWIGFAGRAGRLRVLALPGADQRDAEGWDTLTSAARTVGVKIAVAEGEPFSVVEGYVEEDQQGPLARALDGWTESLIAPLLRERLSLLEGIRTLAKQMLDGPPVYASEMEFLDALQERMGLPAQIFRGLYLAIRPEIVADVTAFVERYGGQRSVPPPSSSPPGSDAPLPGSFRDVTNGTLEVPGGEPIPYTRIRPHKPNGEVVVLVRGYGAAYPIETHVLAKELVGRGYTLYSYTPPQSIDWDAQASCLGALVEIMKRENGQRQVHLIGSSLGANVTRRYLEKNGNSVASAVFTTPAFELTPGIARRHGLSTTLYPPESPVTTRPTFWLFAGYDAVVVNGRAEADLRFFRRHHEQVTYAAHHELYAGGFDGPARAIADWFDRYRIFASAFSASDYDRFHDLVGDVAARTERDRIEIARQAAGNFRQIRVAYPLEAIQSARTLLRDGMPSLSPDTPEKTLLAIRDGLAFLRLMGVNWGEIDRLIPGAAKFHEGHTGQSEHRVSPPGTFGYSDPVAHVGPHITETPEFKRAMEIEPGHVVLDPMTGPGVKSVALARAHPGAHIVALDVSPENLLEAATLADSQHVGAESLLFYQNDVHQGLPPHDSTVDRVVINGYSTFGFSDDQVRAFYAEVFRVLKPGGRLWMDFRHYTAPVGSKHVALLSETARTMGIGLKEISLGRHMNAVAYEIVGKPAAAPEPRRFYTGVDGPDPNPELVERREEVARLRERGETIRLQRSVAERLLAHPEIYEDNCCGKNVLAFLKRFFTVGERARMRVLLVVRRHIHTARQAQRDERRFFSAREALSTTESKPESWRHHFLIELDGRVYDFGDRRGPGLSIGDYVSGMFSPTALDVIVVPADEYVRIQTQDGEYKPILGNSRFERMPLHDYARLRAIAFGPLKPFSGLPTRGEMHRIWMAGEKQRGWDDGFFPMSVLPPPVSPDELPYEDALTRRLIIYHENLEREAVALARERLREAIEVARGQIQENVASCGTISTKLRERLGSEWGLALGIRALSRSDRFHAFNTFQVPGTGVELIICLTYRQFLKEEARDRYPPYFIGTRDELIAFFESAGNDVRILKQGGIPFSGRGVVENFYDGEEKEQPLGEDLAFVGMDDANEYFAKATLSHTLPPSTTRPADRQGGGKERVNLHDWLESFLRGEVRGFEWVGYDPFFQTIRAAVKDLSFDWGRMTFPKGKRADAVIALVSLLSAELRNRYDEHLARAGRVERDPLYGKMTVKTMQAIACLKLGIAPDKSEFKYVDYPVDHAKKRRWEQVRLHHLQRRLAEQILDNPHYVWGRCSGNVIRLVQAHLSPEDKANARVLIFTPKIKNREQLWRQDEPLIVPKNSLLPTGGWFKHVVLEVGGRIYDYDSRGRPGTSVATYVAEMFDADQVDVVVLPVDESLTRDSLRTLMGDPEPDGRPVTDYVEEVISEYGEQAAYEDLPTRGESHDTWGHVERSFVEESLFVLLYVAGHKSQPDHLRQALSFILSEEGSLEGITHAILTVRFPDGVEFPVDTFEATARDCLSRTAFRGDLRFIANGSPEGQGTGSSAEPLTTAAPPMQSGLAGGGGRGQGRRDEPVARGVLSGVGDKVTAVGSAASSGDTGGGTKGSGPVAMRSFDEPVIWQGSLALSVIPSENVIPAPSEARKAGIQNLLLPEPGTGSPLQFSARGGDDKTGGNDMKSRLIILAESRGLSDVARFLSCLTRDQMVKLVRASSSWKEVLTRRGFGALVQRFSQADDLSATDRFLMTAAALVRSQAGLEKLASNPPDSNAIQPSAGVPMTGLPTPAVGLGNPVLNVIR